MSSLKIGSLELRSPVVLAPMAGITNVAFRTLCRELDRPRRQHLRPVRVRDGDRAGPGRTAAGHPAHDHVRPHRVAAVLQLYTVDPETTYAAAR